MAVAAAQLRAKLPGDPTRPDRPGHRARAGRPAPPQHGPRPRAGPAPARPRTWRRSSRRPGGRGARRPGSRPRHGRAEAFGSRGARVIAVGRRTTTARRPMSATSRPTSPGPSRRCANGVPRRRSACFPRRREVASHRVSFPAVRDPTLALPANRLQQRQHGRRAIHCYSRGPLPLVGAVRAWMVLMALTLRPSSRP